MSTIRIKQTPNLTTLKNYIESYVEEVCKEGYQDDDDTEHYIFEAAVQAFYGPKIFEKLNKIDKRIND